jgi:hypothetical protein
MFLPDVFDTTALVSNVALNLFMIPWLGISGAALATSFSYTLAAVMVVRAFGRASGMAFTEVLVPKKEDVVFVWHAVWQAAGRYGLAALRRGGKVTARQAGARGVPVAPVAVTDGVTEVSSARPPVPRP